MSGSSSIFTAGGTQVHSTISQDFSGGRSARESVVLAGLGSKARRVPASSETDPTDNAPSPADRGFQAQTESPGDLRRAELQNQAAGGSNHALQDYQMQLMLLEQQNKKRLMMARQEQDNTSQQIPQEPEEQPELEPIPKEGTAWPVVPHETKKRQVGAWESVKPIESELMEPCRHPDGVDLPTEQPRKRPKHAQYPELSVASPPGPLLQPLLPSNEVLSEPPNSFEARSRNTQTAQRQPNPPMPLQTPTVLPSAQWPPWWETHLKVVHQVICSSTFHSQDGKLFSSTPSWVAEQQTESKAIPQHGPGVHLSSGDKIANFSAFVKNSGTTSFIVFRYYRCSDARRWDHSRGKAISDTGVGYDETLGMVSSALQEIMNNVSQCTSDPAAYYPKNRNLYDANDKEESDPNEYSPVFFYHHRRRLAGVLSRLEGPAKTQLSALLSYVEATQGDRFRELDASIEQGFVHSHNIAMLFCPNQVVMSKPGGILAAHVLRAWPRAGGTTFMLECWHWAFDGGALRRKHKTLDITKPLQETVRIRDLELFPIMFANTEELTYLETRGAKFWSLRYQSFVAYAGWDSKGDQFYTNESRWMVDYRTYRQMHPTAETFSFREEAKVPFDRWPDTISHTQETLESKWLLILPSEIHAFSFKKKNWNSLLVDNIRPVTWNTDAFERLVLPAKTKDLVKSLVMVRASPRESKKRKLLDMMKDDIIAGKGNGLIMLLHGPPGTGKTLTAESVAEIAKMPLYSVTCGDIGTKPEVVEAYLEQVLMLGKRWNCVLLLDEADVFLEERSLADLERNSLVSVFLRTLEYYNGILILTSNRVGTFDAAFTSRIQVALHYDPLTSASRRKIWQNFFDMLQTDEEDVDLDDLLGHFDELVKDYDMNGRQIRNVFTTARQLAIFKGETLTWGHLEQALQSVCKFKTYLEKLHGHTDDQWARDEKLR